MFFSSVGKGGDVDVFEFFLADRLGKTLDELRSMPAAEYTAWKSFHKVRHQQEELAVRGR